MAITISTFSNLIQFIKFWDCQQRQAGGCWVNTRAMDCQRMGHFEDIFLIEYIRLYK